MLSLILNALWDVISYNDFQIPKAGWSLLRSGSGA